MCCVLLCCSFILLTTSSWERWFEKPSRAQQRTTFPSASSLLLHFLPSVECNRIQPLQWLLLLHQHPCHNHSTGITDVHTAGKSRHNSSSSSSSPSSWSWSYLLQCLVVTVAAAVAHQFPFLATLQFNVDNVFCKKKVSFIQLLIIVSISVPPLPWQQLISFTLPHLTRSFLLELRVTLAVTTPMVQNLFHLQFD